MRDVAKSNLKLSLHKSCGCFRDDLIRSVNLMHGMSGSPEFDAWLQMKRRCFEPADKSFHHYGGRGITVAPEWRDDFARFYADVGQKPSPEHSLGRINNNGHYELGNVRWETAIEQANNKRSVRRLMVNGESLPLHIVAAKHGIGRQVLYVRLRLGWPFELAATKPVRPINRVLRRAKVI